MDDARGWLPDLEREGQERYWNGSGWTDRVRPVGKGRTLHLPEHVPELQRALAASTADIDEVEDRLSNLFDRTESAPHPSRPPQAVRHSEPAAEDEKPVHEEFLGVSDQGDDTDDDDTDDDDTDDDDTDDDGAFAELDAALAAEEPEEPKRGLFRGRS